MIYLALGSNMKGDFASPQQLVEAAISNLPLAGAHVVKQAPLYGSAAVGPQIDGAPQDDYVNTVVAVRSVTTAVGLVTVGCTAGGRVWPRPSYPVGAAHAGY